MPMAAGPRRFLAASPVHLATWGLLTAVGGFAFNADLWLFMTGFVGFTLLGFAWHLFPALSRKRLKWVPDGTGYWVLGEVAVMAGLLGMSGLPGIPWAPVLGLLGTGAWLVVVTIFGGALVVSSRGRSLTAGPPERPADRTAVHLFSLAWPFGGVAAAFWGISLVWPGPSFGLWIAGVHLFLLGQVALSIFAVSLRMLPRFVGANAPRLVAQALGTFAISGAVSVPAALLLLPPGWTTLVAVPGLLEAMAALLFVVELVYLALRATTPRGAHAVYVASASCLCVGGAIGLFMVSSSDYGVVQAHVWTNLLGFVGLTVLGMWFSMIAPFQFVSHAWTLRILGVASALLLASVLVVDVSTGLMLPRGGLWTEAAGGIVLVLGSLWLAGSLPVLYPRLVSHSPL